MAPVAHATNQRMSRRKSKRLTDGNSSTAEDLQSDLAPSTFERLEIDTSIDECLRQISPTSLERIHSESERSRSVGRVEEC